jgi:hypothetical protein
MDELGEDEKRPGLTQAALNCGADGRACYGVCFRGMLTLSGVVAPARTSTSAE